MFYIYPSVFASNRSMKRTILTILAFLFITLSVYNQSITIDKYACGIIVLNDSVYVGSGFVMLKPNYVVTCAHVVDTVRQFYFRVPKKDTTFKLKLIKYDIENDLALLESDFTICNKPLVPDQNFTIQPGEHIFYLGYDTMKSNAQVTTIQANGANVEAIGRFLSGKVMVDYIEFVGVGIPGYSGGPVFNDKGQVIAIMREAWYRKGVKSKNEILLNRAFSIVPLLK